jgi:hypothetical protein
MKDFIVKDSKGNVVFKGMGGNANAFAQNNIYKYENLYVHYYSKDDIVLHYYIGETINPLGFAETTVCHDWL